MTALEDSPLAEGRPAGERAWGREPPRPMMIQKATERAKRSSGARGRRPSKRGGWRKAGAPPLPPSIITTILYNEAEGRVHGRGAPAPPLPMISRRPKAGQQGGPGGRSPPGTIIQNYNYITTFFYNLKSHNNIINIIFFFKTNSKPF